VPAEDAVPDRAEADVHEQVEVGAGGNFAAIATPQAHAFARDAARSLHAVMREEALESDARSFAVIALANASSVSSAR